MRHCFLALALLVSALTSAPAQAQSVTVPVTVVHVVDGDTVDVDFDDGRTERLRLIGIDTPEIVDPRKPVQCFGRGASAHAHELLDGQTVSLELDASQGERDTYGRLLAYIWLPDGRNFGEVMIADGHAHEYTYDLPYA
jgi:micrococcal nuclease